jgi:hypothetical protein
VAQTGEPAPFDNRLCFSACVSLYPDVYVTVPLQPRHWEAPRQGDHHRTELSLCLSIPRLPRLLHRAITRTDNGLSHPRPRGYSHSRPGARLSSKGASTSALPMTSPSSDQSVRASRDKTRLPRDDTNNPLYASKLTSKSESIVQKASRPRKNRPDPLSRQPH